MTKQSDSPVAAAPAPASRATQWTAAAGDEVDHRRDWAALVAAGAIPNRNPPLSPENRAILEANDALFRARRSRQRGSL